jgi:TRAP-type C4-dicarboxylate transport system permease small subunit
MHWLVRIDNTLEKIEKALVIFFFAALVAMIAANILARNLFGISFQKILEISPAIVLWLSLLGATLALKSRRHIKLEVLLRYTDRRMRRLAHVVGGLFGALVMGFLFAASLTFAENEIAIFGLRGLSAIVFPLFFAVSFLRCLLIGLSVAGKSADRGVGRDEPAAEAVGEGR